MNEPRQSFIQNAVEDPAWFRWPKHRESFAAPTLARFGKHSSSVTASAGEWFWNATPARWHSQPHLRRVSLRRRQRHVPRVWLRRLASLPARFLLALLWLYRRTLSPVLPVVLGPGCGCRFHPTCAVFAAESVRAHGAVRGSWLAVGRLLRCHPFNPGGFDPVPPSRRRRPTCTAAFQQPISNGDTGSR